MNLDKEGAKGIFKFVGGTLFATTAFIGLIGIFQRAKASHIPTGEILVPAPPSGYIPPPVTMGNIIPWSIDYEGACSFEDDQMLCTIGDPVEVAVQFINMGGTTISNTIRILVGAVPVESEYVTLQPGQSIILHYFFVPNGELYSVCADVI